jgi:hypothetical protein
MEDLKMDETTDLPVNVDDAPTPESASHASAAPAVQPTADEMRVRRILEYRGEALVDPDALQANLGVLNSGLMLMARSLEDGMRRLLTSSEMTEETLIKVRPALDTHLRVLRQIDRFSASAIRVAAQRRANQKQSSGPPRTSSPFPMPFGQAKF